jgi:tRNA threonylcarbamoyladenosine biosynthesis protein TsaE
VAPVSEIRIATAAPDDTRAVAAALAAHLRPGDVVALSGELGAGKTCFVQGAAAALGVTAPVTSPTFVLLHTYPGPVPVVHGDVYRLGTLRDVLDLGEDVFAPDVVTFVEWGDAITALLPEDHVDVVLTHADLAADGDGDAGTVEVPEAAPRRIVVRGRGRHGPLPSALAEQLEAYGDGIHLLDDEGAGSC